LLILVSCVFPISIQVKTFDYDNFTKIVFESQNSFSYITERNSDNDLTLIIKDPFDMISLKQDLSGSKIINRVEHITVGDDHGIKLHSSKKFEILKTFVLKDPFRIVYNVRQNLENSQSDSFEKKGQGNEEESLIAPNIVKEKRKRDTIDVICIDPGHGGSDLGAVGRKGTKEKEVTLSVGKKLKNLIEKKLGIRVVMTRESDVEIALDSRVAKANNNQAQLFLSIHVNSSYRKSASGSETYFVSLKATDKVSMQLALQENSSYNKMEDTTGDNDLKMILWSMAQTEHIKESSRLADYIQNELNILLKTKNRGVKQAPFRVLMRATMPAVLIEIAFVSNKYEENRLRDNSFLNKVAGSIYNGVSKYIYHYNSSIK